MIFPEKEYLTLPTTVRCNIVLYKFFSRRVKTFLNLCVFDVTEFDLGSAVGKG